MEVCRIQSRRQKVSPIKRRDFIQGVRDVIERRIAMLPGPAQALLEVAAVIGTGLLSDVVARALDTSPLAVEAAHAGI